MFPLVPDNFAKTKSEIDGKTENEKQEKRKMKESEQEEVRSESKCPQAKSMPAQLSNGSGACFGWTVFMDVLHSFATCSRCTELLFDLC